jgi:hypothetical protein
MDVPNAMYYDNEHGFIIDIKPGMQHFDGERAEALVRFRRYPTGDIARNAVQMEFMKQLMRQALTREALMHDPMAVINFVLRDIRHNVGADAIRYLPYIAQVKSENITTYAMPGSSPDINGVSYFLADETKLPATIQEVFFATGAAAIASGEPESRPSHGCNIQVLNGSRIAGLGSTLADMLIRDGYTVVSVDSFTGAHETVSRIITRSEGMGDDLIPYFKNAVISHDRGMAVQYDIIVILGRGE